MEIPTAEVSLEIKAASRGAFRNLSIYRIPGHDGLFRLESHAGRLLLPMDLGKVMALSSGKTTKEGIPTKAVSIFRKWLNVEPKLFDAAAAEPAPLSSQTEEDGATDEEEKPPF